MSSICNEKFVKKESRLHIGGCVGSCPKSKLSVCLSITYRHVYLLETVARDQWSRRANPLLVHTARSISLSEGVKGEPDYFQLVAHAAPSCAEPSADSVKQSPAAAECGAEPRL